MMFQLPDHLGDAERRFFDEMREKYRLTRIDDLTRLLNVCEMLHRAAWLRCEVEKLGATITDRFNQQKENPVLELERKLRIAIDEAIRRLPDRRTFKEQQADFGLS